MAKQKAYLVQLEGMGDRRWYLLNEEDWAHLNACDEWDRYSGAPAPVPSDDLVERAMGMGDESALDSREEMIGYLTPDPNSGSMSNDVALSMPASLFNGEAYDDYDGSIKKFNAFIAKHNLDYDETYEGSLY